MQNTKVREPNSSKRKRIPLAPALKQANTINNGISMPGDQVHDAYDDRDPDMIHHFRISARYEEDRKKNILPKMRKEY